VKAIRRTRRAAYRGASILGDVDAALSGDPGKMAKRVVRKRAWRAWSSIMRKLLG
jgi:hypothetical protein